MYNRFASGACEAPGGNGATIVYHCCNGDGIVSRLRGGRSRKISSNRTFVRGEVLCAFPTSDLPRRVLLSARIPHALQSIPMLVCHHLEGSALGPIGGSTTARIGGMVPTADPSEGAGVRSNLGQGKEDTANE
jgi:hypothetical protein